MTCLIETPPGMMGPDALWLISVLQEEGWDFKVDRKNPRLIHVDAPAEDVTLVMEDEFKEGWLVITEEEI